MTARIAIFLWVAVAGIAQTRGEPEFRCQELNNTQRPAEAARCYANLREAAVGNAGPHQRAMLGGARNALWAGRPREAQQAHEGYLAANPADPAGTLEDIPMRRYSGNYGRAE